MPKKEAVLSESVQQFFITHTPKLTTELNRPGEIAILPGPGLDRSVAQDTTSSPDQGLTSLDRLPGL